MDCCGAVVVAAGRGTRMGTSESKQYLALGGKPILVRTLERFQRMPEISEIVLVTCKEDVARCEAYVREFGLTKVSAVTVGGKERQHSVLAGLRMLSPRIRIAAVHDAVRPFFPLEQTAACLKKAEQSGAAVLAVPVKDTIKTVDSSGKVESTPDRNSLWAVQTPQAFRLDLLLLAHRRAEEDGFIGTDDASLVERIGSDVYIVPGDYTNIKITTPDDLLWAERILQQMGEGDTL